MSWDLFKTKNRIFGKGCLASIPHLILETFSSDNDIGHEIMKYLCQQSSKCITQLWRNQEQSAWSYSRSPASNIHQLLIREQWTPDCWTWGALDVVGWPLGGCNLGRGKYNADFRNNSRALAKRFSINDAVQCCKVVLETRFALNQMSSFCLYDKSSRV